MIRCLTIAALFYVLGCGSDSGGGGDGGAGGRGPSSDGGSGAPPSADILVPGLLDWVSTDQNGYSLGATSPITVTLRPIEGTNFALLLPGITPVNVFNSSNFWIASSWKAERDDAGTFVLQKPVGRSVVCGPVGFDGGAGSGSFFSSTLSFRITGIAHAQCDESVTVGFEATFYGAVDGGT